MFNFSEIHWKHYQVSMVDKMSFSEMMIMIEKFHLEIQTVSKSVRKKTEENKEKKISLNRLNTQIQKQS